MRTLAAAGLIAGALVVSACGSGSSGGTPSAGQTVQPVNTPSSTPPTPTGPKNANGCTKAPPITSTPQVNQYPTEPPLTIARTTYTATIVTNCGTIVVALDGKDAPHTVNSFNFLAGKGFFTDTPCFRLTEPASGISVLQCGDPTGTGQQGPGYTLPDENLQGATYTPGTLAMANTGAPHSGDCEWFFVYGPTQLGAKYTPFGTVTSGLSVLKRIAQAGVASQPGTVGAAIDGAPEQPVMIESYTVTKG